MMLTKPQVNASGPIREEARARAQRAAAAAARAAELAEIDALRDHPAVGAVLAAFPGAEITGVTPINPDVEDHAV